VSVDAQVKQLRDAGAENIFREKASGAKTDRRELARALRELGEGDTLLVTRLDRLARSTRDLLNILAKIAERGATFKSLADAWADTTTAHGRLMLTVLGGLAEFERELIRARPKLCPRQGARAELGATVQVDAAPAAGSRQAARRGRGDAYRDRAQLQCQRADDFKA
jgi:DNA invertase Pin-like site-specific DNA recombinase